MATNNGPASLEPQDGRAMSYEDMEDGEILTFHIIKKKKFQQMLNLKLLFLQLVFIG